MTLVGHWWAPEAGVFLWLDDAGVLHRFADGSSDEVMGGVALAAG